MIRAGVGLSTEARTPEAVREAAGRALEPLGGERPDWCVAFFTDDHASDRGILQSALAAATGTPYVVGCSAAGVVGEGREVEAGSGIAVLAVASDSVRATPFLFHDEGDQGLSAGIHLGQRLMGSRGRNDLVVVWPDPFRVRPDRFLHGLDAALGGVPVVGGAASANGSGPRTFQLSGTELCEAGVSGVRLGGRFTHHVAISQGQRPLGEPVKVTRAHENLIFEIEGRPALDALRERAGDDLLEQPERALDRLSVGFLPDPQNGLLRPGEFLVRNLVAIDPDTGVLAVADAVEEGEHVVFCVREPEAARRDLMRSLASIAAERPALDFRFGLYFDCLARGRSLYGQEGVDAGLISGALPGVPVLGFFCNAEIAPLRGANHLFTYSGVLVLVAE